ncbi:MAG: hypothetical protein U5L45_00770 [Saprospiraceae bacterium]|nr:hypothetical protein [Saprospiraceae bacterium]
MVRFSGFARKTNHLSSRPRAKRARDQVITNFQKVCNFLEVTPQYFVIKAL